MGKRLLVTGASGFVGSFIVERALAAGMEVWAGVRPSSSRRYLGDGRIKFLGLDLGSEESMRRAFVAARRDFGAWDAVVHAAGVTKCRDRRDFMRVNLGGTRNIVNALRGAEAVPERFVYMSSLSALGAVRETAVAPHPAPGGEGLAEAVYTPMRTDDTPAPNTEYGRSKAAAEDFLRSTGSFPWVTLRPTGVYGPRDKDYFMVAKAVRAHIDIAAGLKPQELTFVYVRDLADAALAAAGGRGEAHATYHLGDGNVYDIAAFSRLLQEAMGVRRVVRLRLPLWALRLACAAGTLAAKVTGRPSALNNDKYNIMRQRNWQCDTSTAAAGLGFRPQYGLRRGVGETVAWYRNNGWI